MTTLLPELQCLQLDPRVLDARRAELERLRELGAVTSEDGARLESYLGRLYAQLDAMEVALCRALDEAPPFEGGGDA